MPNLTRRLFLTSAVGGVVIRCRSLRAHQEASMAPISGEAVPGFEAIDGLMASFIAKHRVPGAALAVCNNGMVVYSRGFGYADIDNKIPVEPEALFRVASLSKPFTSVAILQLIEEGKLSMDDHVVDYLNKDDTAKITDPRWSQVTVRHCLQHTGGWDRAKSSDPVTRPAEIAKVLGISFPVGPGDVVSYAIRQPLDFDPGERYAYSNLGYLVLGRIMESVTKKDYEQYVKERVFGPLGLTGPRLGKALIENRFPGEVKYYLPKPVTGSSVTPPIVGQSAPLQYGAENFEAFEAHGGWITSAIDLVKFSSAFDDPGQCPILGSRGIEEMWKRPTGLAGYQEGGEPRPFYYGCGWSVRPADRPEKWTARHAGRIAGTGSMVVHGWNGLNWAVVFNTDVNPGKKSLTDLISDPLAAAIDECVTKMSR
ncbi:MAG: D-aminoacylase [Planctomyces sp.]|nr:D-aminoacylase [Planctomyces sp.]